MLKIRLYGMLFAGAAVGAFAIYDQYDKATNFVEVEAMVKKVIETCYLETKKLTTDVLPCAEAEILKQNHPKYKDWTLKKDVKAQVAFRSPVDNAFHTSELTLYIGQGEKVPASGEHIKVLASLTDAERVRNL